MLQNIFKKILQKKYRFILFIIIIITIIAGVYFYKQSIEYFEDEELFEDSDDEDDDKDKEETKTETKTESKSVKQYAFIKTKSCEDFGHEQIKDSKSCEAAAKQLNSDWKYKFKKIEDKFDKSRPKGCAKHPIGTLDFFEEDKSSGEANVTGYEGVYCIKKEEREKVGFEKWLENRQENLDKITNIKCEDLNIIKKERYEKMIKYLSNRNKKIESKIRKISDKIETTKDGKKKKNYESQKKKLRDRQTKLLELTGKVQKIINSIPTPEDKKE